MSVHKFGTMPGFIKSPNVRWMLKETKYNPIRRSETTWEIFAQQQLVIKPKETMAVSLQFGVQISAGVILISLKQAIKQNKCSIRNETVLEDVDNIIVVIENHSDNTITVNEGSSLCYVAIR